MDHQAWALEQLREAVGDKRAHRELLEALIVWHTAGEPGGIDAEPEGARGITFEVHTALATDVAWAFNPKRPLNTTPALRYPSLRIKQKRAALKRAAARSGRGGVTELENLFAGILGGRK